MSEGRQSQVVLLDERRLDIIIQSRLYAGELLDIVASHFNIKEKEYFGVAFIDDTGQLSWLQLDKRVLEHDFPKRTSQGSLLTFYFRVKYFVESITQLRDSNTIEAFFLQAKSLVAKGELEIDSEITFQLAALVIQASYGDFLDEATFKSNLKKVPVLPASTLKEYPSISVCENKVLEHYKSLVGQRRGDAIVNYLSILESLPTYGQHYYEVKDKSGNPCWLGLSYRGISQYDKNDRRTPRRIFLWKQLENLYFRDRKFTIEVHEARRVVHTLSSFNLYEDAIEEPVEEFDDLSSAICDPTTQVSVSRRALSPASVTVYVWYAAAPTIAKCIWSMAIAQHQFFLDRNHKKSRTCVVRSLSQIATELCRSIQSLSSASSLSNISRSDSCTSLPTIIIEGELSEESKAATIEMLTALQSRKDALQEALKKKTEELKSLCLKEGELTGELPPETPFQPGEPQPQVRRRVGTSFTLSDKVICRAKNKDRETLNDLELDYEIQSKIASAAFKLANDVTARKSVRKVRKISYQQATSKLKDIEQKICTLKREKDTKKKSQNCTEGSTNCYKGVNLLGLPNSSSENSIAEKNINTSLSSGNVPPSTSLPQLSDNASTSAPPSPTKCRQRHQSLQHVPIITREVYDDNALPYSVQTRRNSSSYSAASEYETLSCGSSSIASLGIPYRNRFETSLDIEGTNHYSVPNRRASQAFNDPDEVLLDSENPDVFIQHFKDNNPSNHYANAAVLSSSYDERMLHKKDKFISSPENISVVDYPYDKNSLNSNGIPSSSNSSYHLSAAYDFQPKQEKYIHSHSENSLHKRTSSLHHVLEQTHISEPELNTSIDNCETNISLGYDVPLLRNILRPNSTILPASISDSNASNQSLNQVAELVQASVLLQEGKKAAAAASCLEHCSPKTKIKEWVETSLDSPIVTRKKKTKQSDSHSLFETCQQPEQWLENDLPNYTSDSFFGYQTDVKYDDRNLVNNISRLQSPSPSHYNPVCRNSNISIYSSQIQNERTYVNTSHLLPEEREYCHYENAVNSEVNVPIFTQQTFENSHSYYNPNLETVTSMSDENKCLIIEDQQISKSALAEPQQPSKYQNRRIVTDDIFPPDNLCVSEPDYENIPVDNEYELVYNRQRQTGESYIQQCDIPNSHQHYHNFSFKDNQSIYKNDLKNISENHPQNWQQSSLSTTTENLTVSPAAPNINFSTNVEVNVVSVGHFQPYWEETKPYELSDFYKYSTKHRKQQKCKNMYTEAQNNIGKENLDMNHQYLEANNRESKECCCQNQSVERSFSSAAQNQEVKNLSVCECPEQVKSPAKYYTEKIIPTPLDPDKSLSFGEMDLRISLADTFHEEMVTWYKNQDSVKKATLV